MEPEPEPLNGDLNQEEIVGELLAEIIEHSVVNEDGNQVQMEQQEEQLVQQEPQLHQLDPTELSKQLEQLEKSDQNEQDEINNNPNETNLPLTQPEITVPHSHNCDDMEPLDNQENIDTLTNGIPKPNQPISTLDEIEDEFNSNEPDEREWVVEKILDKKIDSKGFAKYLVKWEGYPASSNSWEPLEHLAECDRIMQHYEIERAKQFAVKVRDPGGLLLQEPVEKKRNRLSDRHKLYEVCDIMGVTKSNDQKYFLLSFKNSTKKAFIRTSLANKMFPGKVIDFYVKHIRWRGPLLT